MHLAAHAVSISSSELRVNGLSAVYEFRIPMYEIAQVANPEAALLDHVLFSGIVRTSSQCGAQAETYVCVADYALPSGTERLTIECTLFQITVPNHVHLLTVVADGNSDQEVFDKNTTRRIVRLHPPTHVEAFVRDVGDGMLRILQNGAVLMLVALIFAARSVRQTLQLLTMYLGGEWAMRGIAPLIPIPFTPEFIQAAMILSIVYFAVEVWILPRARGRSIVVITIGLIHGLYFAPLPASYLFGASILQAGTVVLFAWRGISRRQAALQSG